MKKLLASSVLVILASVLSVAESGSDVLAASRMDDNFNDNSLDPALWNPVSLPSGAASIIEVNHRVQIALGTEPVHGSIRSVCTVAGDFDVRVDFRLLTWPARSFRSVGITAQDLTWSFDAFHPRVFRLSQDREFYAVPFGPVTPTSDMSGTLRLTRTGSTIAGYYFNGQEFVFLSAAQATTNSTRIALHVQGGSPDRLAATAAFDNFQVHAGTIECPTSPAPPPGDTEGEATGIWGCQEIGVITSVGLALVDVVGLLLRIGPVSGVISVNLCPGETPPEGWESCDSTILVQNWARIRIGISALDCVVPS